MSKQVWLSLLKQPSSIAAIVSVGVHGLLFAASPSFSSLSLAALTDPTAQDGETTVPLVELTPEEQSRLPDFSPPAMALLQDLTPGSLTPGGLTPGNPSGLPNQSSPKPGRLNPTDRANSLSLFNRSVPSGTNPFGLGYNPSFRRTSPYRIGSNPSFVLPPISGSLPPITTQPGAATSQATPTTPATPNPGTWQSSGTASADTETPAGGTVGDLPPEYSAANLGPVEGARENPDQPASEQPTQEDLIALVERIQAEGGEVPPELEEYAASLQAVYAYAPEATTEEEAADNVAAWTAQAQETLGVETLTPEATVEVPEFQYPYEFCLEQPPGPALIGVLVDDKGDLVGDPALLRSSGYAGLNDVAVQSMMETVEFSPSEEGTPKAYLFQVTFKYDEATCDESGEAARPGEPSATEAPTQGTAADTPASDDNSEG